MISPRFRVPILLAIALMTIAALVVKIVDLQTSNRVTALSLREISAPTGPPLFTVESSPYARYLRDGIAIDYDGETWKLQHITEVDQAVDRASGTGEVLIPETQYLSRSYRDYDRDTVNALDTLDEPSCLALPEDISSRVRNLSRRMTQGMITPFEKAKAIETYLQVKYDYALDYEPAPEGWEPNDWFLFESREGVCGNFNSAFVILARASGIPARLAYGYYLLPGDGEPEAVYPTHAHAWAEVGFQGLGWVTFEATPP